MLVGTSNHENDTGVMVDSTSENELVKLKGAVELKVLVAEADDEIRPDEDAEVKEADDPVDLALAVLFCEPTWLDELAREPETDVLWLDELVYEPETDILWLEELLLEED